MYSTGTGKLISQDNVYCMKKNELFHTKYKGVKISVKKTDHVDYFSKVIDPLTSCWWSSESCKQIINRGVLMFTDFCWLSLQLIADIILI